MDKITKILLIVAVILIIIWGSMTFISNSHFDLSNSNQNTKINDNSIPNGHNATIKILSEKTLTKNEKVMVQLFDNNNQPMANKYVSCRFFNSSSVGNSYTASTNENGIAEFSLDYLNYGFYGIELEYKSYDDNIGGSIIQDNIEIKS